MKNSLKLFLLLLIIFIVIITAGIRTFTDEDDWLCINGEWTKHGNPSAPKPISFCEKSCVSDNECETPGEFLMQSNCPFASACIGNQCRVICPLFESECSSNEDCNCDQRSDRSLNCLCLKGECVSVEA
jgi:hypothetical protein